MSQIVGATHPGNRDHNEDCFVADASLGLGLVADGMGGYACGEVASDLVRQTVMEAIANNEGLRDAIVRAHSVVKREATDDQTKKGMGSTVVAFRITGQEYELAWVGDSRAYLWDATTSTLHQITRDHSYVETLLSSGAISHDEAINHPNRNLITQAIGVPGGDGLEIELISGRLGEHQQLLICSDGLVDEVIDAEIATILAGADSLDEAVASLVERAISNGGSDNVTVVLASCLNAVEASIEPEIVRSTPAGSVDDTPLSMAASLQVVDIQRRGGITSGKADLSQIPLQAVRIWNDFVAGLGLPPTVVAAGIAALVVILVIAWAIF